ncbi:hypothetical protein LTR37_002367 [Vermiconidia calcicola]|uniref:Uncharacterized protein n=1 Tax=Vermiconidia calcicola TaxID=1690605 RepID=A0ACC3NTU7_9PEZI|nr:hypothetical protein LTR37_002367 [Vermiconidia calcicola]
MRFRSVLALSAALVLRGATSIELDLSDPSSITSAASSIAHGMMTWYTGNQTGQIPGILPPPYYWWEAGAMFGTLIDYWYYTGDSGYNDVVKEALLFQVGPEANYMPPNQSKNEGNDDQAFWGFTVMTAAEYKFPNPPPDQPQWLALAQGVWNSQQLRWDRTTCNGGLRWQIYSTNNGYDYKHTPSNAAFMNLGARLYAYTGNETYAEWTVKAWDWMYDHGLIKTPDSPGSARPYSVFDGTYSTMNCTDLIPIQWTYNAGMLLNAAAVMWNATGDPIWEERVNGLWASSIVFFKDKVMWEVACEPRGNCNTDQLSFKAYFSRFMAASTKWMPQLYNEFQPFFAASAQQAAKQCSGDAAGLVGNACGFRWTQGSRYDGTYGFGQQMGAMEVILANMIEPSVGPVTAKTGGISKGDPSAGTGGDYGEDGSAPLQPITAGDKAGASILTAVFVVAMLGGAWWMIL